MAASGGFIEVLGRHNPMQFFLYFIKLTIEVDGRPEAGDWRQVRQIPVEPGEHDVRVYFKYFKPRSCEAGIRVQVAPGQVVRLQYSAPQIMTSPGKLTSVS